MLDIYVGILILGWKVSTNSCKQGYQSTSIISRAVFAFDKQHYFNVSINQLINPTMITSSDLTIVVVDPVNGVLRVAITIPLYFLYLLYYTINSIPCLLYISNINQIPCLL